MKVLCERWGAVKLMMVDSMFPKPLLFLGQLKYSHWQQTFTAVFQVHFIFKKLSAKHPHLKGVYGVFEVPRKKNIVDFVTQLYLIVLNFLKITNITSM